MKKIMKNVGIIALAIATCMLPQINALATVIHNGPIAIFNKQYVDSNEWTYVCYTSDTVSSKEVSIKIDTIYTASGAESLYQKVKVSPSFGNTLQASTTLELNKKLYYTIPLAYRNAGNQYLLFAMGNNPALDCQISGFFTAH